MTAKLVSCLALTTALVSTAAADTKSWTAIKGKLASDAMVALSVDVAQVKKGSKSVDKVLKMFLDEERDAKQAFAMIEKGCALKPLDIVTDVSLVIGKSGDGVVALGLSGVDEAKLVACANKLIAQMDPKMKITAKAAGGVSEYAVGPEKLYAWWPQKDVVVFGTEPDDKQFITAAMAGKGASGDLATYLGKVDLKSVLWAAGAPNEKDVKGGYGSVTLAAGMFKGNGKIIASDPKEAAKGLKEFTEEHARALKKADKLPAAQKFLKALKITQSGAELTIDGALDDASVGDLIPQLDKIM